MKIESPKYHYTKSIWAVLLCYLLAVSCAQEEELAAVGYLSFPGIEVSQTVEDMAGTRAVEDLPEISTPAVSAVTFVIKDAANNIKHNGVLEGPQPLPEGTYSVEASYNTNSFGIPYLTGTKSDITIKAGETTTQTIGLSLQNSLISVSVDESLKDHFIPDGTVTISAEGITETETETVNLNTWYYVPSGKKITLTIPGKSSAGVSKDFTYTIDTTIPQKAYTVYCGETGKNDLPTITLPDQQDGAWNTRLYIDPATISGEISETNKAKLVYEISTSSENWSDATEATQIQGEYYYFSGLTNGSTYYVRARIGKITSKVRTVTVSEELSGVSVTSAHYNDGDGNLAGTNATLNLGLTGILKTLNDEGLLIIDAKLTNGSTTTYRTASADGVMAVSSGWPYIPQGTNYTLTVSQKLSSESTSISFDKTGFEVPAPEFTVTLGNSYSSYDEGVGFNGITKNVGNANSRDPETIYNVSASWKIAESLRTNSNYTTSLKIYTNTTEQASVRNTTANSYNKGNITGLTTWQAYILKAAVTFAGTTIEANKTHHITGLPYFGTPPNQAHWTPSTTGDSEVNWNNPIRLNPKSGKATIYCEGFHVPAGNTLNIWLSHVYEKKGMISVKYRFILGSTYLINQKPSRKEHTYEGTFGISQGNSSITMEAEYSMWHADTYYINIKSLTVKYED